jgi:hypothetical protein
MNTRSCLARVPLALLLLATAACGHVVTQVELDRMTNTTYPQPELRDGETWDLFKIYQPQGILLGLDTSQTNIARLAGGDPSDPDNDFLDDGELDNLAAANRTLAVGPTSAQCGGIGFIPEGTCVTNRLYGIVTDHWYEKPDGTQSITILGVMWDSSLRSSFAMFYRHSTVNSDNGKYLRSVSHEIGHSFNLHHEDGNGSNDIMNQTGVVGDTYVYTFDTSSSGHLRDHNPRDCTRPGTGRFDEVDPDHTVHSWVTATCN